MPQLSLANLVARFLIASTLVLGGAYQFRDALVSPLIPAFREIILFVDPEFMFYSVGISHDTGSEMLTFRANLSAPVQYGGRTIYPVGWNGGPQGGYQCGYSLSSVFLYPSFLLIGVVAWPARRLKELLIRIALTVPLLLVLLCIDVPSTVIAELWNGIRDYYSVPAPPYGMVWSRFLMGGGGLAIAGVCAVCATALAKRLDDPKRLHSSKPLKKETGYARLVMPKAPRTND